MWNCAIGAIPQGRDEVLQRENDLSLIKRERNKDAAGSIWETLLAFMPSVFPLQPSCHVAFCSSDSWSPQPRSLLAWNLCDGYKGKTIDYKRRTRNEYKGYGWEWNCAAAKQSTDEWDGIGRQHGSSSCVTDAVSQWLSFRACPSANGHSSPFGMLFPINEECRFDELLVRFRRWVGQSGEKGRRLDGYKSST